MTDVKVRIGQSVVYPVGDRVEQTMYGDKPQNSVYTARATVISLDDRCVVLFRRLGRDEILDGVCPLVLVRPELICDDHSDEDERLVPHIDEPTAPEGL